MTHTFARLRPRARLRRWLVGSHQPIMSIRLSAVVIALLALLTVTVR
ncbi:hypothetical protein [Jiangella gansuensis]|nr:hypothetical protein [Jiangella gansuensis]